MPGLIRHHNPRRCEAWTVGPGMTQEDGILLHHNLRLFGHRESVVAVQWNASVPLSVATVWNVTNGLAAIAG